MVYDAVEIAILAFVEAKGDMYVKGLQGGFCGNVFSFSLNRAEQVVKIYVGQVCFLLAMGEYYGRPTNHVQG